MALFSGKQELNKNERFNTTRKSIAKVSNQVKGGTPDDNDRASVHHAMLRDEAGQQQMSSKAHKREDVHGSETEDLDMAGLSGRRKQKNTQKSRLLEDTVGSAGR